MKILRKSKHYPLNNEQGEKRNIIEKKGNKTLLFTCL